MKTRLLIVDDEACILESAELALKDQYEIITASSVEEAQNVLSTVDVHVVVTDLGFPGQPLDGLDLMKWLSLKKIDVPVIVLSGDKDIRRIVSAQRRIQDDFIVKPFVVTELIYAIEKALLRVKSLAPQTRRALRDVITQDQRILAAMDDLRRLMESDSYLPACIYGEPGTGKEELAKYAASAKGGPFIAINMAAIPANLVESELFGHKKGSFTGAITDQIGKFQAARGGVIFLDEIGDCTLEIQVKLLRVLQEREIVRVGANAPEKIDVKVVVATNKNLRTLVEQGLFRKDLLDRIEGLPVTLPPLRERPQDIPLLVAKFLTDLAPKTKPVTITSMALKALQEYSWPGNVRELRTTIERAIVLSGLSEIDVQHLPVAIVDPTVATQKQAQVEENRAETKLKLDEQLDNFERRLMKRALEIAGGSRKDAVKLLGISESRFFRRARALQLSES